MLGNIVIPFRVAIEHLPGLAGGNLVRYGAILKDASTGRIVGHVQETGLLQGLLQTPLGSVPLPGVTNLVGVAQNLQIQSTLNAMQSTLGTLQGLQIVTLASSFAGLGVSAANLILTLHRLREIDNSLKSLEAEVSSLPARWRELDLQSWLTKIETQLERMAELSTRKSAAATVERSEEVLDEGFNQLNAGVLQITVQEKINPEMLSTLLAALSLCSGAQIKALLWLDEKQVAATRARKHARKLEKLAFSMPRDVLEQRTAMSPEAIDKLSSDASDIRMRIASLPSLAENLIRLDVNGRDYVDQIEAETEDPLLFLPTPESAS